MSSVKSTKMRSVEGTSKTLKAADEEGQTQPNWFLDLEKSPNQKATATSIVSERKTKIICTLGNKTSTVSAIEQLIDNGMNMARLNLGYLSGYEAQMVIRNAFAQACKNKGKVIPLLVELQGPSIRIGDLPNGEPISLLKGSQICITSNRHYETGPSIIYCDCQNLPKLVIPGQKILISKGLVSLTVKAVRPESSFQLGFVSCKGAVPFVKPRLQNMSMMEAPLSQSQESVFCDDARSEDGGKKNSSDALMGKYKRDLEEKLSEEIYHKMTNEFPKVDSLPLVGLNQTIKKSSFKPGPRDFAAMKPSTPGKKGKTIIVCEVDYDCVLRPRRELYIPKLGLKKDLGAKIIDVKDIKDLSFWADNGADFVGVPHVESIEDIEEVRELIGSRPVKILAKIQNCVALHNLTSIIEKADGILIGRGGLSLNLSPAHLVFVQDYIINKCKAMMKPVILAAPIMDSMIRIPSPTTAEADDIVLAITQGVDGMVLGGETALGDFFLESLRTMGKIAWETELRDDQMYNFKQVKKQMQLCEHEKTPLDVICSSAVTASMHLNASLIIVYSKTGKTAMTLSRYRPRAPILAVTGENIVARYCDLGYGIHPLVVKDAAGHLSAKTLKSALEYARSVGLIKRNSLVVVTTGLVSSPGGTNTLTIMKAD